MERRRISDLVRALDAPTVPAPKMAAPVVIPRAPRLPTFPAQERASA